MNFAGVSDLMKKYQDRASAEGVDPFGYYMAPHAYAQMQVLEQAVQATKSLDDQKLAEHIRSNAFKTVVGDLRFGRDGKWVAPRMLQVQFQNIKGNDPTQFRDATTQIVIAPDEYASGQIIYPYDKRSQGR
jgi:branched-chain amino acid transport system substrate-binding protein